MTQPPRPSDDIHEQASLWYVRLREPGADETLREAHRRWLAADPRHAEAFAEAGQLWDRLAEPVARVRAEEQAHWRARRQRHRLFRPLAAAACLVLALGAGLLWQGGALEDLRSDYHTAVGQRQSVTLADGSLVELNTHSALAVSFSDGRRHVRLLRGEAWFEVRKDPARPFVVELPEGTVTVTGTRFNVRLDEQRSTVSLVEGRVELDSAGQHAELLPDQQSCLDASGLCPTGRFDSQATHAWRQGQMVFYRTPLKQVIAELERYHRGHVFIQGEALARLPVSGVFATASADAVLQALHDTLGVKVTPLGLGVVILR
ncbi:FecR family protein [Pseudomonas japonica]|uniref:FecR family protein n=1 Tax=Pseudomonas japonica TaxID=256466 RepID=UPI003808D647